VQRVKSNIGIVAEHSTVVNDSVDGYDGEHETENSNKSVAFRLRGKDGGRHGLGAVVRAS
jgi:hypothetical protein